MYTSSLFSTSLPIFIIYSLCDDSQRCDRCEIWGSISFWFWYAFLWWLGFPCGLAGKESACSVGDLGSIPGLGMSPREGKGYPLQYSGLEKSMDCIVHGVAKSWTQLSDFHSLTHSLIISDMEQLCMCLLTFACLFWKNVCLYILPNF